MNPIEVQLLGVALVIVFVLYLTYKIRKALEPLFLILGQVRNVLVVLWRWCTGMHLDGEHRTDASWLHPATRSTHDHATPWHHRPRLHRAGHRTGGTVAVVGWVVLWYAARPVFWAVTGTSALAVLVGCGWAVWRAHANFRHRRDVVRPFVTALAPALEAPRKATTRYVQIPRDFAALDQTVRIALPPAWRGGNDQKQVIHNLVDNRLGGDWAATWNQTKAPHQVVFRHKPAPPSLVRFTELRDEIENAGHGRVVIGVGAEDALQVINMDAETPHVAMSAGTGAGKSTFLTLFVAQLLHRGEVEQVHIIDCKLVSLAALETVPGVYVWTSVEEGWAVAAAIRAEVQRRFRVLKADRSATFPRLLFVLEEQNEFMAQTNITWERIRGKDDPKKCPFISDIATCLFQGRQVNVNLIGVYQRMSVVATGGQGEMRDSFGYKVLSRFSHHAWDSLVGTRPRGVSSNHPGRGLIVTGGTSRAVQLSYEPDTENATEYALNGRDETDPFTGGVDVLEDLFPEVAALPGPSTTPLALHAVPDDPDLIVGLRDAAEHLEMTVVAFTRARERAGGELPGERKRGRSPAWMPEDLDRWAEQTGRVRTG